MGNFAENLNLGNRFRPPLYFTKIYQALNENVKLNNNLMYLRT